MLFSEPKIPQSYSHFEPPRNNEVSVLFSEPKIPQLFPRPVARATARRRFQCSSASRKFLNTNAAPPLPTATRFQCSSASRKFLNTVRIVENTASYAVSVLFSEPKIPQSHRRAHRAALEVGFQCSSASRKFLNSPYHTPEHSFCQGFSALQRAENSSIGCCDG